MFYDKYEYNNKSLIIFMQFDCGIYFGLNGFVLFFFLDFVEVEEVDLFLISQ